MCSLTINALQVLTKTDLSAGRGKHNTACSTPSSSRRGRLGRGTGAERGEDTALGKLAWEVWKIQAPSVGCRNHMGGWQRWGGWDWTSVELCSSVGGDVPILSYF